MSNRAYPRPTRVPALKSTHLPQNRPPAPKSTTCPKVDPLALKSTHIKPVFRALCSNGVRGRGRSLTSATSLPATPPYRPLFSCLIWNGRRWCRPLIAETALLARLMACWTWSFHRRSWSKTTPRSFAVGVALITVPFMVIDPMHSSFFLLVRCISSVLLVAKRDPVLFAQASIRGDILFLYLPNILLSCSSNSPPEVIVNKAR